MNTIKDCYGSGKRLEECNTCELKEYCQQAEYHGDRADADTDLVSQQAAPEVVEQSFQDKLLSAVSKTVINLMRTQERAPKSGKIVLRFFEDGKITQAQLAREFRCSRQFIHKAIQNTVNTFPELRPILHMRR